MSYQPWYYFLSIESDFIRTLDFVELDSVNGKTFSNEYAKLLLLIGSEIDVVAKTLCYKIDGSKHPANINEYQSIISGKFIEIYTIEIELYKYNLKVAPWAAWGSHTAKSPVWWKAYNSVKHQRDLSFPQANQENVLHALCGLMALLLYVYKDEPHLQPYPKLLNYGFPRYLVTDAGKKPPGA